MVTYTVYGPASDSIQVGPILGIGRDNSDKGANKALTQALKYALLQLLQIGDRSSDNDGTTDEADKVAPTTLADIEDRRALQARYKALDEQTKAQVDAQFRAHLLPTFKGMSIDEAVIADALLAQAEAS